MFVKHSLHHDSKNALKFSKHFCVNPIDARVIFVLKNSQVSKGLGKQLKHGRTKTNISFQIDEDHIKIEDQ